MCLSLSVSVSLIESPVEKPWKTTAKPPEKRKKSEENESNDANRKDELTNTAGILKSMSKANLAEATREVERQLLNEHVYGCALRGLPSCDFLLRRLWGLRLVDWLLLVLRLLMLVRLRLLGMYTEEHMGSQKHLRYADMPTANKAVKQCRNPTLNPL